MADYPTRLPEQVCPWCGTSLSAASDIGGDKVVPKSGDLSLCIECASPLRFGEGMLFEPMTEAEVRRLMTADEYAKFQWLQRQVREFKR